MIDENLMPYDENENLDIGRSIQQRINRKLLHHYITSIVRKTKIKK